MRSLAGGVGAAVLWAGMTPAAVAAPIVDLLPGTITLRHFIVSGHSPDECEPASVCPG